MTRIRSGLRWLFGAEFSAPSLLLLLRLAAVIGTLWLGAVVASNHGYLRHPFVWVDFAFVCALWSALIFNVSNKVRFFVVEISCMGGTLASISALGWTPAVDVLTALGILLATLCYGVQGGLLIGLLSLAIALFGAGGWLSGFLPVPPVFPMPQPKEATFWMRVFFAVIFCFSGIVGLINYVGRELRDMLVRLDLAEQKFAKVFRICPNAMTVLDLETGRFIEVNESHEEMTGYRRDEVIGRTPAEFGMYPSAEEFALLAAHLRKEGSVRRIDARSRNRDGRVLEINLSAECFDLAGQRCVVAIIQDVTETKRAEAALVANEARFRSFIENASVGIYRSTPGGQIVMANKALVQLMGYGSLEELASRNLESEGYEPGYSRQIFKQRIEKHGWISGLESAWKRKDGTTIHIRESANVLRGPDGTILFYDGIIEDISEQKQAERALRESEERYRNLTAAAFEGVIISDDGTVIDANDQALAMFGYSRIEAIGRPMVAFVSPECRETVLDNIVNQRELAYQIKGLRKDGEVFEAEARTKMMRLGERSIRMTAVRDISERLQNERRQRSLEEQLRQTQKLEALGTLAGGIAHDFNNILTAILGNLQLTEMELPASHPGRGTLDSSIQACRRARDLVSRVLSFSRLELNNRVAAPLGPTIAEAVQLLKAGVPAGVEIRLDLDATCAPAVFDSGQIHQVVMNLGTNALHAMQPAGGTLTVALSHAVPGAALMERQPEISPKHTIRLCVADTGCGMERAVLDHIFEPFYTTKPNNKGTGLGLAMVHAIVKSHGGAIVVDSAPGKGTRFDLYFPAADIPRPETKAPAQDAPDRRLVPFGRGRRVLLVDDEPVVLNLAPRCSGAWSSRRWPSRSLRTPSRPSARIPGA
jgi:two-component system, cell cycle sensor histidine kinase and response regulator CckA